MQTGAREESQRPFPAKTDDAQDDVEDLQGGNLRDGRIQVLGEEVPEDLGPEDGLDAGADLVCSTISMLKRERIRMPQDAQAAAVKMTRRAQWFLISFPMATAAVYSEKNELKERTR